MKYRKKPVVVDAEQFTEGKPWPRGVEAAKLQHNRRGERDHWMPGAPTVITVHGQRTLVADGDWIIAEADGIHYYPCKPDIFEQTYEIADAHLLSFSESKESPNKLQCECSYGVVVPDCPIHGTFGNQRSER